MLHQRGRDRGEWIDGEQGRALEQPAAREDDDERRGDPHGP
jgi:hypothetical protein